jgi:hypothetical protein
LGDDVQTAEKMLRQLQLSDDTLTGEKIHEVLFQEAKYKTPSTWKAFVSYFF